MNGDPFSTKREEIFFILPPNECRLHALVVVLVVGLHIKRIKHRLREDGLRVTSMYGLFLGSITTIAWIAVKSVKQ